MSEEIQGWRDIIQQNGKRKQPQLTIPKSIADLADKEFKWLEDDVLGFGYSFIEYGCESSELRLWVTNGDCWDIEAGKRANILSAYLAGKALGVDLVKVVADD